MKKLAMFVLFFVGTCGASQDVQKNDAESEQPEIVTVKEGNLALSSSQQPGPLFSFGQNMVDKGDLQLFVTLDSLKGTCKRFNDVTPTLLYGITNKLSLFVYQPIARFRDGNLCSSGLEDMFVQFEYAFYTKAARRYFTQLTAVGALVLPFGSSKKNPPTGFGSPSVFLGLTASYNGAEWYLFADSGVLLPTPHHGTKFGTIFFYQCGLGRNITYIPEKLIFMWMVEFFGYYRQKDRVNGCIDPNSGSNLIFVGPSLWFSTTRLIIQGGIAAPIVQQFEGMQRRNSYFASLYLGWKFN